MHAFVDFMDFTNARFVDALRMFLQSFRLPGDQQTNPATWSARHINRPFSEIFANLRLVEAVCMQVLELLNG
jgi:hypothetical protein